MKIQLKLSPNTKTVPFNHLHQLTQGLHRWLGPENCLHDGPSLYSFGWLKGGIARKGGLTFPAGATWQISFHDEEATRKLLMGIINDPYLFCGMQVYEVQELPTPNFGEQQRFLADGPIVARQKIKPDGSRKYLLHDAPDADLALTASLRRKLNSAGLPTEGVSVSFDRSFMAPRLKMVEIKGINHIGSICPVVVQGSPEVVRFAWLVGAGELTGCGFGALSL